MPKTYLVTGGAGFLGSALVRRLVREGNRVRVFDNGSRGSISRLHDLSGSFEPVTGDIRDAEAVGRAVAGVDSVCHLAFVNGTEFFYSMPDVVLDVGVKGIVNVLDACRRHGVPELILASSSEVYQNPPTVPTSETVPLSIPDPTNPRYSYAAGKIISEIMALNYGRTGFERVLIFRPHNVYGPAMGWEHVIPQFVLRLKALAANGSSPARFAIQGTGEQTRSFIFIDDFVDGLIRVMAHGAHLGIYNIGTQEETTIAELARMVADCFGKRIEIEPGPPAPGAPDRRCPDISKMKTLGFEPKVSLREGLFLTAKWYDENSHMAPTAGSRKSEMTILDAAPTAAGTGSSVVVERCQVCNHAPLKQVLFLGYLPPVNQMRTIGDLPREQPAYPALLLACPQCNLVQLGLIVDKNILFPPEYPYTSGTTKILRDNFADLYTESQTIIPMGPQDLAIDIGSNDGTLLSNFQKGGHRVFGIEPSQVGELAVARGIPTTIAFFDRHTAEKTRDLHGPAKIVTATNVFAHIEHVHDIVSSILLLMDSKSVFISESHYLLSLVETLQYDTIYHEHLRYYSLQSLQYLLKMHGLEVIHAHRIPTHGGSIRVYAARGGEYPVRPSVSEILKAETVAGLDAEHLKGFKHRAVQSKLDLYGLLRDIKKRGHRIYGIGAPSRASTLIHYVGLDDGILECVLEIKGSLKIGKYMPGTLIPVLEENRLYEDQPEYALLLSWHIADELIPKLKEKGYKGKYICPLPAAMVL